MLLQAECNLVRICDLAWELLLGQDVCSMTREQRKAINIPQGDNDNRKPPGTADLMGRKIEDPEWGLGGVGFSDKDVSAWTYTGRFLVLPENIGLLSQLNWQLSVSRAWSAYCRWISFFMLLLFCSSILQSSCWSDFSRGGLVARARTLHLPSSALLQLLYVSFCTLLIIKDSDSLKISLDIISSKSGCHVVPLSFKILGSILDLSLIQKPFPPLSECMAHLNCKGISEFAALFM